MIRKTSCRIIACISMTLLISEVSARVRYRKPMVHYPKDTVFWATDFFTKGCKTFMENCPTPYKYQLVCGRSYSGDFRNFANYCEMQYENCNSWKNWRVYKREKC